MGRGIHMQRNKKVMGHREILENLVGIARQVQNEKYIDLVNATMEYEVAVKEHREALKNMIAAEEDLEDYKRTVT